MHELVEKVVEEYGTRDPYELAKKMDVTILYEDLGDISSYYNVAFEKKFIHVNSNIHIELQYEHAIAAMLYYAIIGTEYTVVYHMNRKRVTLSDEEINSEKFASLLLELRKRISESDNFEKFVEDRGGTKEDKEHLEKWFEDITQDIPIPEYVNDNILDKILYLVDEIERR